MSFLVFFCVHDAAATCVQYLALSKTWWSCYCFIVSIWVFLSFKRTVPTMLEVCNHVLYHWMESIVVLYYYCCYCYSLCCCCCCWCHHMAGRMCLGWYKVMHFLLSAQYDCAFACVLVYPSVCMRVDWKNYGCIFVKILGEISVFQPEFHGTQGFCTHLPRVPPLVNKNKNSMRNYMWVWQTPPQKYWVPRFLFQISPSSCLHFYELNLFNSNRIMHGRNENIFSSVKFSDRLNGFVEKVNIEEMSCLNFYATVLTTYTRIVCPFIQLTHTRGSTHEVPWVIECSLAAENVEKHWIRFLGCSGGFLIVCLQCEIQLRSVYWYAWTLNVMRAF